MPETIAAIPVKQLSAMIARTMFAISMEESRFTLNGALMLLGDQTLTMVATDGHRLASCRDLRIWTQTPPTVMRWRTGPLCLARRWRRS